MQREARGSVQQHVFLSQIEQMKIPVFSDSFYDAIEKTDKKGFLCSEQAKNTYAAAETLPPEPDIPSDDMQKLMQSAYFSLRKE